MCFYSESECTCLISIHTISSYDLKLVVVDFLSGKMKRAYIGVADLTEKLVVVRRLENELRTIRRRIDTEANLVKKAKMLSAYNEMTRTLTGKEM